MDYVIDQLRDVENRSKNENAKPCEILITFWKALQFLVSLL